MKRINKKFRNSWFYQWNYSAPIYWLKDWLKKNHKRLYRFIFKGCAILLGIWLSYAAPMVINDVYADFTNHQILLQKQKMQIEKEARDREIAYLKKMKEIEDRKMKNAELKREEEERQKQEIEDEIKSEY